MMIGYQSSHIEVSTVILHREGKLCPFSLTNMGPYFRYRLQIQITIWTVINEERQITFL